MIRGIWKIFIPLVIALVVVVGLFILLERPPSAAELDPEKLMRLGGEAFRNYEVNGSLKVTVYRDGKTVKSEKFPSPVEPWLREKMQDSGALFPEARLMAYRFLSEMNKRLDVDEEFLAHHSVKLIGPRKVAGRWAWEMEIRPDTPDSGYIRVSLDTETGYPVKREKFNWRGEKENTFEYTKISGYGKRPHFPPGIRGPQPPGPPRNNRPGRPNFVGPEPPPPGDFRDHGFIPPEELKKLVSDGSIPYPTRIPPGYSFKGARAFPPGPMGHRERLQLIFSDGLNTVSIFMIHLPPLGQDEGKPETYIKEKLREFHDIFPEGFAIRKTDEGLLLGVGDISPKILDDMLDSVTRFDGEVPLWPEGEPPDPEELF